MTGFTVNYLNNIAGIDFNDQYLDANGNLAIVQTGDEEVEETCNHAVQLTQGDYSLNNILGIPYDRYLSSDQPVGIQIKRSITQAILAVNGVDSLDSFTANLDATTRKLQIDLVIRLLTGAQISVNV